MLPSASDKEQTNLKLLLDFWMLVLSNSAAAPVEIIIFIAVS